MTSSNINKIVRSNINLKPWILSKNTSVIVNTCIQKIYKQSQNNFKHELFQPKVAQPKPENKAPIRSLRSQERERPPISINVRPKGRVAHMQNTGENNLLKTAMNYHGKKGAVASLTAHKKLLKSSPNYKIYSSRRFGSSASSSNASIFRRNDERRRQTAHLNFLLRSFGTSSNSRSSAYAYALTPGVAKYIVPTRNQHMQSRSSAVPTQTIKMSSNIQRDLMMVNHSVKDRIALGRTTKLTPVLRNKEGDPMEGWNHPPHPELFLSRFNERSIASLELQEQYNRLKVTNKDRQFQNLRQMERKTNLLGVVGKRSNRERLIDSYNHSLKLMGATRNHETATETPTMATKPAASLLPPAERLTARRFTGRETAPARIAENVDAMQRPANAAAGGPQAHAPQAPAATSLPSHRWKTLLTPLTPAKTSPPSQAALPARQKAASAQAPSQSPAQAPPTAAQRKALQPAKNSSATSILASANAASPRWNSFNGSRFNRVAYYSQRSD